MEELHQHKKALGTIKNNSGNKHEKTAQKTARYTTSVDPTYMSWVASVKPVLVKSILQSLWTTAPVIGFDFVGSSGVC